jgi:uncharacterized Zn finger protein
MPSLADLSGEPELRRLAGDRYEAGAALVRRGEVELRELGPLVAEATVGNERHEVVLRSADGRLEWSCSCLDGRSGRFCDHAAATALEASSRARERPA